MLAHVCLAIAIFMEAGIEPPVGQMATGLVVVNGSQTLHKKPVSVCREIHSGKYIAVNRFFKEHRKVPHSKKFLSILDISKRILDGRIPDFTGGANHFECTLWKSCKQPPSWAASMEDRGMFGTQHYWKEKAYVQSRTKSKVNQEKWRGTRHWSTWDYQNNRGGWNVWDRIRSYFSRWAQLRRTSFP